MFFAAVSGALSVAASASPYDYQITSQADLDALPTLTANMRIGVQRGLTLRGRIRAPFNSAVTGVLVEAYGSGNPPIIDCSDIIPPASWTNNADGTWSCSVDIDTNIDNAATTYPAAYQDGRQLIRRADAASVVSGAAGGYWAHRADAGTNMGSGIRRCTVTIKPFSGSGPILGSEEFSVSVRGIAVAGPDSWTVRGIHARRNASLSGSIVLGRDALIDRCICEWGNKHNWQCESGEVRDTIAINIADGGSGEAGTGGTLGVFYRGLGAGLNWRMVRCGFVQEAAYTVANSGNSSAAEALLFHTNGSDSFNNIESEQCWAVRTLDFVSGSPAGTIAHTGGYAKSCGSMFLHSTGNPSITACLVNATAFAGRLLNNSKNGQTYTIRDCAFAGTFSGASLGYSISDNPTLIDIQNCVSYAPTDNEGATRGNAATWRFHNNIVVSQINAIRVTLAGTLDLDANYYYDSSNVRNSFLRDNDASSPYNSLALWQAATGQDATSVGAKGASTALAAGFSGTPTNGDFRLTAGNAPSLLSAGMSQHWDWNARALASGPATAWPNVPETLADAIAYVSDPSAWVF